ncbi:MAG: hypothetical protein ACLTX6_00965 [Lachnospiraceae bacterium]
MVTFKKNAGGKKVTITATAKDGSKKFCKDHAYLHEGVL